MLLVGYFEGLPELDCIASRCAHSLTLRGFLRVGLDGSVSDHSTVLRTRRLIEFETHAAEFHSTLEPLVEMELLPMEKEQKKRYLTLDEILQTVPAQERPRIVAELGAIIRERKRARRWVTGQVESTLTVPAVIYKYVPRRLLGQGAPWTLRATQPVALNDVMEGNVMTMKEDRELGRDDWYELVRQKLCDLFDRDAPSVEEFNRRKRSYGDPRVSTEIRKHLSRFVGVISFSADPLVPTMWAHYAESSGFVIGYRAEALRELGFSLRRVLYMELAPNFLPMRGNVVEVNFVDEERRRREPSRGTTPILESYNFTKLTRDWRSSASLLYVKSRLWQHEEEVRLLVDQATARATGNCDADSHPVRLVDVPDDAITEVYAGLNTPDSSIQTMMDLVNDRHAGAVWHLRRTDWHAYRIQARGVQPMRPNNASRSMRGTSG